jgi:hypothetical protein
VNADEIEPFYCSPDASLRLYGRPWDQVARGRAEMIRCFMGRHRRIMWSQRDGQMQERCSCGATKSNEGRWTGGRPTRQVRDSVDPADEYARLQSIQRFLDSFHGNG